MEMTDTVDTGELLVALEFAAAKHRDQRRKDEAASPYINHPLAVVTLLWTHGVRHRVQTEACLARGVGWREPAPYQIRRAAVDVKGDLVVEPVGNLLLP